MNQQTKSSTDHTPIDVLIVGAGPTGLTAALELARHGITFRLIEKSTQRSPYSKEPLLSELQNWVTPVKQPVSGRL